MIREFAAALGGILSGLAVFIAVLLYPSVTNSANITNTGLYRSQPTYGPIYTPANLRFTSGASGVYSGIIPGLLLLLLAVGAGFVLAYVGMGRLRREDLS